MKTNRWFVYNVLTRVHTTMFAHFFSLFARLHAVVVVPLRARRLEEETIPIHHHMRKAKV